MSALHVDRLIQLLVVRAVFDRFSFINSPQVCNTVEYRHLEYGVVLFYLINIYQSLAEQE